VKIQVGSEELMEGDTKEENHHVVLSQSAGVHEILQSNWKTSREARRELPQGRSSRATNVKSGTSGIAGGHSGFSQRGAGGGEKPTSGKLARVVESQEGSTKQVLASGKQRGSGGDGVSIGPGSRKSPDIS